MTPTTVSRVDLPSEALKSILSFMSRKELVHLSQVNHQFHHVANSPPLTKKPLLRAIWLFIPRNRHSVGEWSRMWIVRRNNWYNVEDCFHASDGAAHIEPIISPEWMRFKNMAIYLPREYEHRRAWLELLDENSHCLLGAWRLVVKYKGELEADLAELMDKLAQGARVMQTTLLRD